MTGDAALEIAAQISAGLGYPVSRLTRLTTGLCHHVFEVELRGGGSVVMRLGRPETAAALRGGVTWHGRLAALGLPVPALLHSCLEGSHPYMVLERLPGRDLIHEYPHMSGGQKQTLARELAAAQLKVAGLPRAAGYGFARDYGDPSLAETWLDVVSRGLERSRSRLPGIADEVARRCAAFAGYWPGVEPVAFLDDITTKNVIVHEGRLSGIVDTDCVCFGDRLYTLGLTRAALLSEGLDAGYVDAWGEALDIDDGQRQVVELYTAVFCVDFLAELGQSFNRDAPLEAGAGRVERLLRILERTLDRIDAQGVP